MESEYGRFFLSNYRAAEFSAYFPSARLKLPARAPPRLPGQDEVAFQDLRPSPEHAPAKLAQSSSEAPEPPVPAAGTGLKVLPRLPGPEQTKTAGAESNPAEDKLRQEPVVEPSQTPEQPAGSAKEEFPALPRAAAAAAAASEALKQSYGHDGKNLSLNETSQKKKKVTVEATDARATNSRPRRRSNQAASGSSEMPTVQETSVTEMDEEVTKNLEAFFADDESWQVLQRQLKLRELSTGLSQKIANLHVNLLVSEFKVSVPKPYPGVQYRRSKDLEERYSRYAENGTVVFGQLEADGQWLRISGNIFLPVRVGQIHILDEADEVKEMRQLDTKVVPDGKEEPPEGWLLCCPSNANQKVAAAQAGGVALEKAARPMRPGQQ